MHKPVPNYVYFYRKIFCKHSILLYHIEMILLYNIEMIYVTYNMTIGGGMNLRLGGVKNKDYYISPIISITHIHVCHGPLSPPLNVM